MLQLTHVEDQSCVLGHIVIDPGLDLESRQEEPRQVYVIQEQNKPVELRDRSEIDLDSS